MSEREYIWDCGAKEHADVVVCVVCTVVQRFKVDHLNSFLHFNDDVYSVKKYRQGNNNS